MNLEKPLLFSSISFNGYNNNYWNSVYASAGVDGKFIIDISRRFNPCRFVARNGVWELPWEQDVIPGFEMPSYDPNFNKTFEEVSDARACEVKARISNGEKFAMMYSGGIDSTAVMCALIRNLTKEELKSVVVCSSADTIMENPYFWATQIVDKFVIRDSSINKYHDLIEQGYVPITADEGDGIFGTVFGLQLYANYDYYLQEMSPEVRSKLAPLKYKISDGNVHYSNYKEIIIRHLQIESNPEFGRLMYEKMDHNVKTASVPVHSLHDFFWWEIFNIKYSNCAVRGALYYNDRIEWRTCIDTIMNWYSGTDFQRWSMVNNNNGLKIQSTHSSYKNVARDYIWSVDKNDWYRNFKIKIDSMNNITISQDNSNVDQGKLPVSRLGLTGDYEMMYVGDPLVREFFHNKIVNYKRSW
jgi:hypothetical protein